MSTEVRRKNRSRVGLAFGSTLRKVVRGQVCLVVSAAVSLCACASEPTVVGDRVNPAPVAPSELIGGALKARTGMSLDELQLLRPRAITRFVNQCLLDQGFEGRGFKEPDRFPPPLQVGEVAELALRQINASERRKAGAADAEAPPGWDAAQAACAERADATIHDPIAPLADWTDTAEDGILARAQLDPETPRIHARFSSCVALFGYQANYPAELALLFVNKVNPIVERYASGGFNNLEAETLLTIIQAEERIAEDSTSACRADFEQSTEQVRQRAEADFLVAHEIELAERLNQIDDAIRSIDAVPGDSSRIG